MSKKAPKRAETGLVRIGLSVVFGFLKIHPVPFAASVIGAATFAAATVASTIVLGQITDQVVLPVFESGELPPSTLKWAVVALIAVALVRTAGVMMRRFFAAMTVERTQMTLRRRLVEQYLGLPLSWYSVTPAGRMLAHADSDTDVATEVMHPLPFSLGAGFLVVFAGRLLIVTDPLMALVALAVFPTLAAVNQVYSTRVAGPAAQVQAGVGEVSSVAHESFDGALVVKTLGRAEAEIERFAHATNRLRDHRVKVAYLRAGFEGFLEALPALGMVAVVVIGAIRVGSGQLTHGEVVQIVTLFNLLIMPMRVLGFFLEMIPPSVVSHRRLVSVFSEPLGSSAAPAIGMATHTSLKARPIQVEATEMSFSYQDGPTVLSNLSLEIKPGEVVAVVGSTGAGKSTLVSVLAGLVQPDSGIVRLAHRPIGELDPQERTSAVAVVFQESFLFADTLRANIDLQGTASDAEIWEAAQAAEADGFIRQLPAKLETVIGERGVTLSGGQRQRVALARALLRRPRLLFLDDATSAVDSVVEANILAHLRQSVEATIVIVAQRLSTIELADRVLYLVDGQVKATGTHSELLAIPGYAALARAYEVGSA